MKHVPFTNEQEIPDILTKWKAPIRDGPLENLLGGGRERSTKKYSRKGKLNEKNSCTPTNPKKYSCYGLKEFIQGIR